MDTQACRKGNVHYQKRILFRWQLIRLGASPEECAVELRVVELCLVESRSVVVRFVELRVEE